MMNQLQLNIIHTGDALKILKTFPDNSVHCCVTSPPYYGLRCYGHHEQIGKEQTPEKYVEKIVQVFTEVKRVLKNTGTLWLNIGDSYAAPGKNRSLEQAQAKSTLEGRKNGECLYQINKIVSGLKPKDQILIPFEVAKALRGSGYYLRDTIIWYKPNPMPESVTDRCTKAHEYIFLLSKSSKYYYNAEAIKTPVADATVQRMAQQIEDQKGSDRVPGKTNGAMKAVGPGRNPRKGIDIFGGNQGSVKGIPAMAINGNGVKGHSGYFNHAGELIGNGLANKKSVWTVTTKPFKEAHFATFPQELIIDMIKAGCPENGVVLDPFMGGVRQL